MTLYTTDMINALNAATDADDDNAVHKIAVEACDNPRLTPLDWMALGRASIAHPEHYGAWHYIETVRFMGIKKQSPENRHAYTIGCIAARIERDQYEHTSLDKPTIDLTANFLATAYPISLYHRDPHVNDIATWAVHILEERRGQQMGLIPA